MIKTSEDFEKLFVEKFGDIDRTTLSNLVNNKLRFELGAEEIGLKRFEQALDRSYHIFSECFRGSPIWLRIILWDKQGEIDLKNAGLVIENANSSLKRIGEEEVLYLYFKKYSQAILSPVMTSIINYELAQEPSANITCYFINFEKSIIVNIYDDRGVDVYALSRQVIATVSNKFHKWLIDI